MQSFLRFATLVESATFCTTERSLSVGAVHKVKQNKNHVDVKGGLII
jgi:hypothetical protein